MLIYSPFAFLLKKIQVPGSSFTKMLGTFLSQKVKYCSAGGGKRGVVIVTTGSK